MTFPAGPLRHRVTIEEPAAVRDAYGQAVETWRPVATVWMAFAAEAGSEAQVGEQQQAKAPVTFRSRWRAGCGSRQRLVARMGEVSGRVFGVQSVTDPTGLRVELVWQAVERADVATPAV